MTTLYVAGPMTGLPGFNYPAFHSAADQLRAAGYEVFNPVDSEMENTTGAPQRWSWYMRRALAMVVQADGIALLPDWRTSKGAQLEVHVAVALDIVCFPVDVWLEAARLDIDVRAVGAGAVMGRG